MTRRAVRLLREDFPEPPARDTAVSHAILRRVSDGLERETLRIHRPGDIVAFGPKDRLASGFPRAVAAARDRGFGSVHRLAGGRAAVFTGQTIAFSWAIPDPDPQPGIRPRFERLAGILADALRTLGVDARVGEVRGEYCPGEYSVNAGGRTKLMGVGQRVLQRAAHVGGVVVVGGSDRIRDVLVPVNEALDLRWDPTTVGSLQDEVAGVTWDDAATAILARFGVEFDLEPAEISPDTLDLATLLEDRHAVTA